MISFSHLTHVSTDEEATGISILRFRPGTAVRFAAGQFGLWIAGSHARPFTIASAPGDEHLELATNLSSGTPLKRKLGSLSPGSPVRLVGPIGSIAPPDDGLPVVFLSQGVGITPARSILREPSSRDRTLLHVGRPHFRDDVEPRAQRSAFVRRYEELAPHLADAVERKSDAYYLLSGSRAFVTKAARDLAAHGVDRSRVRTDAFLGLKDPVPTR